MIETLVERPFDVPPPVVAARKMPLALRERAEWIRLLRAFDQGSYRSKAEQFLPSLDELLVRTRPPRGHVLDAGCGNGLVGRELQSRGWEVRGVDLIPEAIAVADRFFPSSIADIADMRMPRDSFSVVLCSMVLMLVDDVDAAITEIARVLGPGGTLLLAIANPDYGGEARLGADGGDEERIERWAFHLEDGITEVQYHRRPLEAYTEAVRAVLHPELRLYVDDRGRLSEDIHCRRDAEYIWITARKARRRT